MTQLNTIVRQETDAWIQEFQSTLKQIDEAAKAKAAVSELGAVNITVSNGDTCEDAWNLSIDQGTPTKRYVRTAGVRDLVPGVHTIKVDGVIGGGLKHAEAAVPVTAGGTASVQLTLS